MFLATAAPVRPTRAGLRLAATAAGLCLLSACSEAPAPADKAATAQPTASVQSTNPAATQAQAATPSAADCQRPASPGTGADVIGLRLGLPAAEAQRLMRCRLPQAVFESDKSWFEGLRTHGVALGPQVWRAVSGRSEPCQLGARQATRRCGPGGRAWLHQDEYLQVATLGLPGQESVHGIWRSQQFEDGRMPAIQDMESALRQKYGEPTLRRSSAGHLELAWLQTPDGKPMAKDSREAVQCRQGMNSYPGGRLSFSEDCGQTLVADVEGAGSNPALAARVSVGLMHQRTTFALGERMQSELDRLDAQRRQGELDRAKAAAPAVKL